MTDQPVAPDELDGSFRPRPRPSVASVELDGEAVLYDEESGATHLLNPVATVIWACLDGASTVDELIDDLSTAYGTNHATVANDTLALFRNLGRLGVLDEVTPTPPSNAPKS